MLTLKDLIRRSRSRLRDKVPPYLWDECELLDCINDTVRDAAIRANLVVQDDIPLVFTQNTDLSWKAKYALDSGVLAVKSVYLVSQPSITLHQTSFQRQNTRYHARPTEIGTPAKFALDQTMPGTGDDYGVFVRAITFIPQPIEADTAMLEIVRLPTLLEEDDDVPEIDEIYHPDLIAGITGLAYLKKDSDTFDPTRSKRDLQLFEDRFGIRLPASVMRERQTDVPSEMILG